MIPRFILLTTAAVLLAACDRPTAVVDNSRAAEIAEQRQAELAANDKIRELEERLNAADRQKAADREAELAKVKEELAEVKQERADAAERIRDLQEAEKQPAPAPVRQPDYVAEAPRTEAVRADLERVVEEEEDREPVYTGRVVPETQRVASVESFYEPLDPYGDWIETDDYGYVFRPQVATRRRDWQPYTDGRWVNSDYGWTWQSNEDFGWATYHYGRWARASGSGWVWVPGRDWGPGWVSWRRGKDHCGWAPLPPESRNRVSFSATVDRDYDIGPAAYIFVALSNFGARSYDRVIERPERNVTLINSSVNITNIAYNNVENRTVVHNGGPSYDLIRRRSREAVENVNVNFAPQTTQANQTTTINKKIVNIRQGDTFQIAAPPVVAAGTTAPLKPLRVKEKLGKTKLEKGWDGVTPAQAKVVRQEIAETSKERKKKVRPVAGEVVPVVAGQPAPVAVPSVLPAKADRPGQPPTEPLPPVPPGAPVLPAPEKVKPQPPVVAAPEVAKPDQPRIVAPPADNAAKPLPESPIPKSEPRPGNLANPERPDGKMKPEALPKPEKVKPVALEPKTVPPVEKPAVPEPERVRPNRPQVPETSEPPAKIKPPKPDRPALDVAQPTPRLPKAERPIVPETPKIRPEKVAAPEAPRLPKAERPQISPQPEAPRLPKAERSQIQPQPDAPRLPKAERIRPQIQPEAPPQVQRLPKPERPQVQAQPEPPRVPKPERIRQEIQPPPQQARVREVAPQPRLENPNRVITQPSGGDRPNRQNRPSVAQPVNPPAAAPQPAQQQLTPEQIEKKRKKKELQGQQ